MLPHQGKGLLGESRIARDRRGAYCDFLHVAEEVAVKTVNMGRAINCPRDWRTGHGCNGCSDGGLRVRPQPGIQTVASRLWRRFQVNSQVNADRLVIDVLV